MLIFRREPRTLLYDYCKYSIEILINFSFLSVSKSFFADKKAAKDQHKKLSPNKNFSGEKTLSFVEYFFFIIMSHTLMVHWYNPKTLDKITFNIMFVIYLDDVQLDVAVII